MLLNDDQYTIVWDMVYKTLHFHPSVNNYIIPFKIAEPHIVYDIGETVEIAYEEFDRLITDAFIKCTIPGEKLYALDWHHSAFLFDPRVPEERQSVYLGENKYLPGHGLYANFPAYYPDGDYYFFIDQQFRFGYLSHPWRKEVWIFGDCLISEFQKIFRQLGWTVKEDLLW